LPKGASGLVVVTETEIFGRQRQRRPALNQRATAQRAQIDQLLDFSELVEGDFVVHLQHGIALYRGLTKLDTAQGMREVISLEFDDQVTLHVPLQESHLISRYVGLSKTRPQPGRIGSGRWEKARQAAERATIDLAAELLRIHAAREAQPGHAFPPDTTWQKEFEASFPFTETRDQLRCIRTGGVTVATCRLPTPAYKRSFGAATVDGVVIVRYEALAMLSNREMIRLQADGGTWRVLAVGGHVGRGFFEKPG
jgi:transcription-repair coupling factor (superfamily II helicase)